ncbi:hypothetical protein SRB17_26440 [Streptomyces sp. RB17]|uniref:hypothetical protein n=1 Tax=Streptomyces sp. RB17 TaxID=2585197 RepID=UPI001297DF20|nr:hypothetical protein [Streptomyces sp. RB17]MQY34674.1 hypothetical protein [Streptomyces sp. RB17]
MRIFRNGRRVPVQYHRIRSAPVCGAGTTESLKGAVVSQHRSHAKGGRLLWDLADHEPGERGCWSTLYRIAHETDGHGHTTTGPADTATVTVYAGGAPVTGSGP